MKEWRDKGAEQALWRIVSALRDPVFAPTDLLPDMMAAIPKSDLYKRGFMRGIIETRKKLDAIPYRSEGLPDDEIW
jgi:hypothetical protein